MRPIMKIDTELKTFLGTNSENRILLIGVGNELLADDKAGLLVIEEIEKIKEKSGDVKIKTISAGTAPENFFSEIKKCQPTHVIIVDAAQLNQPAGTVQVISLDKIRWTTFSTHTLPLYLSVEYLKENIGCETMVVGIQPKTLEMGAEVSEEVKSAVETLAKTIVKIVIE